MRDEQSLRIHGSAPFSVAVVHGGPGAAGEMAPVARELSRDFGVLEPFQTAKSVDSQVQELMAILLEHGSSPIALIGHSWGAWLSFMLAARHPRIVKKLILVSSGPFEERYVAGMQELRMSRLTKEEQFEYARVLADLSKPASLNKDDLLSRLAEMGSKTDAYDPIILEDSLSLVPGSGNVFENVWNEAAELRRTGKLLKLAGQIQCPVVAIHGAHDPHPAAGVNQPLSSVLKDFRFILLDKCGHTPWLERQVRDSFYVTLRAEIAR